MSCRGRRGSGDWSSLAGAVFGETGVGNFEVYGSEELSTGYLTSEVRLKVHPAFQSASKGCPYSNSWRCVAARM